jgi:hypothetical protein
LSSLFHSCDPTSVTRLYRNENNVGDDYKPKDFFFFLRIGLEAVAVFQCPSRRTTLLAQHASKFHSTENKSGRRS